MRTWVGEGKKESEWYRRGGRDDMKVFFVGEAALGASREGEE